MQTTPDVEQLPDSIDPDLDLDKVKKQCRELVKKRAKYSAGAAVVPVPFFDVVADAGMLTQLLPEISERFGLISDRESAIDLQSKEVHWAEMKDRAVEFAGLMATRGIVKKTIQGFGGRIVAKQVTKFVPLGGQIVSASLGYMIFKKIAFDHIDQCYKLAKEIQQKQHSQTVSSAAKSSQNDNTDANNTDANKSTEKKSVKAAADDKSIIDTAADKASKAVDQAAQKVDGVVDEASKKADELAGKAEDQAHKISDKAGDVAETVADKVEDAANKVSQKADEVADKVSDTALKASEKADEVADKAASKTEEVADKAAKGAQQASKKADEAAQAVKETANEHKKSQKNAK